MNEHFSGPESMPASRYEREIFLDTVRIVWQYIKKIYKHVDQGTLTNIQEKILEIEEAAQVFVTNLQDKTTPLATLQLHQIKMKEMYEGVKDTLLAAGYDLESDTTTETAQGETRAEAPNSTDSSYTRSYERLFVHYQNLVDDFKKIIKTLDGHVPQTVKIEYDEFCLNVEKMDELLTKIEPNEENLRKIQAAHSQTEKLFSVIDNAIHEAMSGVSSGNESKKSDESYEESFERYQNEVREIKDNISALDGRVPQTVETTYNELSSTVEKMDELLTKIKPNEYNLTKIYKIYKRAKSLYQIIKTAADELAATDQINHPRSVTDATQEKNETAPESDIRTETKPEAGNDQAEATATTKDEELKTETSPESKGESIHLLGLVIPKPGQVGRAAVFREEVFLSAERMRFPQDNHEQYTANHLTEEQKMMLRNLKQIVFDMSPRSGFSEEQYEQLQQLAASDVLTESLFSNMPRIKPHWHEAASSRVHKFYGETISSRFRSWRDKVSQWRSGAKQKNNTKGAEAVASTLDPAAHSDNNATEKESVTATEHASKQLVSSVSDTSVSDTSEAKETNTSYEDTVVEKIPETITITDDTPLRDVISGSVADIPLPLLDDTKVEANNKVLIKLFEELDTNNISGMQLRSKLFDSTAPLDKNDAHEPILKQGTQIHTKRLVRILQQYNTTINKEEFDTSSKSET